MKIIFRVGLVLLKHTLGSSDKLKSCQGQYETMERLRALSPKIMQETFLVQEVRCWGGLGAQCRPVGHAAGLGCPGWAEIGSSPQKVWIWGYLCAGGYLGADPAPGDTDGPSLSLPRSLSCQ